MRRSFNRKNTPVFEFLLDMDGVFFDFDGHAQAQEKLDANGKLKWDELDRKWWSTMPLCEGAKQAFYELKKIAPSRFLTAPVLSTDCFFGKAEAILKFIPGAGRFALLSLIICPSKDKHLLASPTRVLIDDREDNVRAWREAGGIAIHHKGDFAETVRQAREIVAAGPQPAKPVQRVEEPRIFVNVNQVLADFRGHAAANGKFDANGKVKWDELDMGWWKSMPAFPGADKFFQDIRGIGVETRFLSSPVASTEGFGSKPEWIQKFLPARGKFSLQDIIVCRASDKRLIASANNILVDDDKDSVEDWRKSGGIAILHEGDFAKTLAAVNEAVAGLEAKGVKKPMPKPKR